MNRNVVKKISLALLGLTLAAGLYLFFTRGVHRNNTTSIDAQFSQFDIRPFDNARDREFIKQQNYEDWYLLHSTPDYDLDFMMDTNSPYHWEPRTYGKLSTVVLFDDNKPVGFVNYYMRGEREGTLFLLSVNKSARGKGYGKMLCDYAVQALKKQGARYIKVSVRQENERAQNIYRSLGFKLESSDHEGFYFYRLDIK